MTDKTPSSNRRQSTRPRRRQPASSKTLSADAIKRLVVAARTARQRAYAPYSQFNVGAALRSTSGRVFIGCNVENRSFGLTVCAERSAIMSAVSAGHRSFECIVIATGTEPPAPPCGACREVLAEFAPKLPVILVGPSGTLRRLSLAELLPEQFVFKG